MLSTGRSEKCLDPAGQFGIVVAGQDPGLEQRSQMATIALVWEHKPTGVSLIDEVASREPEAEGMNVRTHIHSHVDPGQSSPTYI